MNKISELLVKSDFETLTEEELLDLKIEVANSIEGKLNQEDGVNCDKCKNRGYVTEKKFYDIYNRYDEVAITCECSKKRSMIRKAINSGLGEYLKKDFNDFNTNEEWQNNCKGIAQNYLSSENEWFMMCGQSGSGKTLLCSIIANNLLKQDKIVQYITWTDFISKIKRDMMGDNTNQVSDYLESVKKIEILFIDELLKKYNETDLKYIIEIINYRYTNNLKTIITSERDIQELLDIDEATFGRVIEKCVNYIISIPKDRKKNYRLKNIF